MGLGIGFGVNWGSIKLGLAKLLPSFVLDFANIANDFNFTRSSFATRVNEFGLIETVTDLSSDLVQNGDFEEIGSELVVDGNFDGGGKVSWILATGHTIGDGVLKINSTGYKITTQSETLTVGKTYKVTFNVLNYVNGRVSIGLAGSDANNTTTNATSNGSYEFYVTRVSGGTNNISIITDVSSELEIDNVSVKEVDPNDDWGFSNAGGTKGWRIADGKAICDETGVANGRNLDSSLGLTSGVTYKLTLDILQSADNMQVYVGGALLTPFLPTGTNLGYEYIINGSDHTGGILRIFGGTSDTQEIDNISVQEVSEDDVPRIDYSDATFDVPVLGDELVVNGSFDTDSNWAKQSGWSIANGKATFDINDYVSGNANIYQSCMVVGKEYVLTYDVVDYVQGYVRNVSGSTTIPRTANGTYTEKFTANNANIFFKANIDENTKLSIDNVSVKEVTAYTTTDKGSFLLEPQSTNLITYSEEIDDSSWVKKDISVTANDTNSLDGTLSADLISSLATSSCVITAVYPTLTIGNTYNFSCFAKKGNNDWIRLGHVSSASSGCWFDLENGVVGTVNSTSATIEDYGNGWYRCTNTFVATSSSDSSLLFIGICDTDNSVNAGAVGKTDYIWGAQFEALPYATSYIPTNGSIATRSAETCVDATPTINSEEGVLYAEISALADEGGFRLFSLNDGTSANIIQMYYSGTSNRITGELKVGGSAQTALKHTVSDVTDFHKVAFKYKQNDFALWIDGVEVDTDNVGSVFAESTLTELDFDIGTGSFPFYGNTKDLKIYDKALSDSELEELTTI